MSVDVTSANKTQFMHGFDDLEHGDPCIDEEDYLHAYSKADMAEFLDGLQPGCYRYGRGAHLRFTAANSYHGFIDWQNYLSLVVYGTSLDELRASNRLKKDTPFEVLLMAGRSELAIGPITSMRMLADFRNYPADVMAKKLTPFEKELSELEWPIPSWIKHYQWWSFALEIASDEGLLTID